MRHYVVVENEAVYVEREARIVQRLAVGDELEAYQVDTSTKPPTLRAARLGSRREVVANVVMRDLEVEGEVVAETQIQEPIDAEDNAA